MSIRSISCATQAYRPWRIGDTVFRRPTVDGQRLPVARPAAQVLQNLREIGYRPKREAFGQNTATLMVLPRAKYEELIGFLRDNRERIVNPENVSGHEPFLVPLVLPTVDELIMLDFTDLPNNSSLMTNLAQKYMHRSVVVLAGLSSSILATILALR